MRFSDLGLFCQVLSTCRGYKKCCTLTVHIKTSLSYNHKCRHCVKRSQQRVNRLQPATIQGGGVISVLHRISVNPSKAQLWSVRQFVLTPAWITLQPVSNLFYFRIVVPCHTFGTILTFLSTDKEIIVNINMYILLAGKELHKDGQ